jgi:AraC-like DNA-binding protein
MSRFPLPAWSMLSDNGRARMDIFERIERAIGFIEANLKEDITLDRVASEACSSPFHFHRSSGEPFLRLISV